MEVDITEKEYDFILLLRAFDFLRRERYEIEKFSLFMEPFILYRNNRIKQDVYIEWYSLFDVNVKITKYGFFHERSFEIRNVKKYFNDNLSSLKEIRRSALGCQNEIEVSSNIIQQHLMPVIRGEMWIDELLP